ncbi:class I glutamine amidotransferase-like protein [Aspergillus egyptiacus]|nr:class I glutamine amidotransferase-like protein [Aspergillus egyptiacus]
MRPALRIAILECDTPPERIDTKYNGLYGIFIKLFSESATELNNPDLLNPQNNGLDIARYDVVTKQEYPDLESVDAILMTGSKHNSFDDDPWILKLVEYTKKALESERVKIVGICFGHQILARAMGVRVGRNAEGWEIAVCDVELSEKGKELFGVEVLKIQQMHRDIVFSLPPDTISLGSSPRCEVQGMYRPGKFITLQGHPEYRGDIVRESVNLRAAAGIFDKEQAEDALRRAEKPHDGVKMGVAILKFLME